jgi:hypothetical protein
MRPFRKHLNAALNPKTLVITNHVGDLFKKRAGRLVVVTPLVHHLDVGSARGSWSCRINEHDQDQGGSGQPSNPVTLQDVVA